MLKKFVLLSVLVLASVQSSAKVTCVGKITDVVVWSSSEKLSIMLEGTNRYIKLTTTAEITAAMTAFAAQKTVHVHFSTNINECENGWPHYTLLQGYIRVEN